MKIQNFKKPEDAIIYFLNESARIIKDSLKLLLEAKHLYQNINIDFDNLVSSICDKIDTKYNPQFKLKLYSIYNNNWDIIENKNYMKRSAINTTKSSEDIISLEPPDVKLFCKVCGGKEAYNLVSCLDFLTRDYIKDDSFRSKGKTIQIFILSYLCQSCKNVPEVFMIRREGLKIILSGRTPMEHIDVPKIIPKNIKEYYSSAIIAYQSGQVLAGLFFIRTLIEQWTKFITSSDNKYADEALGLYMEGLPKDFKDRFKSLKELYGELSIVLHKAELKDDLFNISIEYINEHFEARRLFKLNNTRE